MLLLLTTLATGNHAAAQENSSVPVRVEPAREAPLREIVQLTGSVTAARQARLSPATAGLVTQLHVDVGSVVGQGDTLLVLDPELADWQARSASAEADAASAALADARRRLSEARSLAPQQSIAETVIRDLAAEVNEDEALSQRAQAELGYRRAVLDRHTLKAPFAGVLSNKLTELGEWVAPGEPVLELVATSDLYLDFRVAEKFLGAIGANTRLSYTTGNDTSDSREARIETIVPVSDPGARSFLLRTRPVAPDTRLIPGMAIQGTLQLDSGRRGLVIPRDAILRYPDGRILVWAVATRDNQSVVEERRITTGLSFEGLVEVRTGLAPGERVVVEGNEALQMGQPVSVIAEP
tara:strand:- start:11147 stop:12205 length:1059 start_codon:yes stop_codon:yes gene_type:complete